MKNTINFLGLASITLLGFSYFPVSAQTPQTQIQSIVLEGQANQVSQKINQYLNLNFIYLPQIQDSVIPIPNLNIQDNPLNNVTQITNQRVLGFPLVDTSLMSFTLNDFLQNDNTLTGKQFITQEILIEGNLNSVTQESRQTLTDFFWLDPSSKITNNDHFSQFLDKLLDSQALDSLQFGLQDTFVFGNDNKVTQLIDQTFDSFILTSDDFESWFNTNLPNESKGLDPVQFTVQHTSIVPNQNNIISQTLNQVISGISFINPSNSSQKKGFLSSNNNLIFETNSVVNFDINEFIDGILNNTIVEATQKNQQRIQVQGNENKATQVNQQALTVSVPEPSLGKIMVVLLVMIGLEWCYEKP